MQVSKLGPEHRWLLLALVAVSGVVGRRGAGADWPMYKKDAARSGAATEPIRMPPTLVWRFSGDPLRNNPSSPVVEGDSVFFCSNKTVYCLDVDTGSQKWKYETLGAIYATPALLGNTLYIASTDKNLYAIDTTTGRVKKQFKADLPFRWSSPLVAEDVVYICGADGQVYALSPELETLWTFQTGGDIVSSPAYRDGLLYITSSDAYIYCLEVEAFRSGLGRPKWRLKLGDMMRSSPVVMKDRVWVGSGNALFSIPLDSPRRFTQTTLGSEVIGSPVVRGEEVYVGARDGVLYAVNAARSRVAWKCDLGESFEIGESIEGTASLAGTNLLIGTNRGLVHGLDLTERKVVWKYQFSRPEKAEATERERTYGVHSEPAVVGKDLYVVAEDGGLYHFQCEGFDSAEPEITDPSLFVRCSDKRLAPFRLKSDEELIKERDQAKPDDPKDVRGKPLSVPGTPPVYFAFRTRDQGSGINDGSIEVTLNGKRRESFYDPIKSQVTVTLAAEARRGQPTTPMDNGLQEIRIRIRDWAGNEAICLRRFEVDNGKPPPEPLVKKEKQAQPGGGGLGQGGPGAGGPRGGGRRGGR